MDDTIIRPPDQIAAGGTAQPTEQGGIIDALRSRGPMPQAALANIMQPPMQANIGLAAGSGSLAALPGGAGVGANPYLSGVNQQNKDQFYQQLNMQREQRARQAQQDQRADREFARNQAMLTIEEGVLSKMDPSSPLYPKVAGDYAKQLSQFTGNPLYGQLGSDIATKKLAPEEANEILAQAKTGMSPELITQLHPNIPPARIKGLLTADPKMMERWGVENEEARQTRILKIKEEQGKAFDSQHKEVGRGTVQGDYASERFRQLRNKPIVLMDDNNPEDVAALTQAVQYGKGMAIADEKSKREFEEHKIELRAQVAADKAERAADRRTNEQVLPGQWIDKQTKTLHPVTKAEFMAERDRYRNIGASEEQMFTNTTTALQMTHRIADLIPDLLGSHGMEQVRRGLSGQASKQLRNDPNWAEFFNLVNESNIELARVVGGSGQLRVSVLDSLKEAGLKGWETKDVGHRILGTIENSINNRRNSIISGGDVNAMQRYSPSSRESTQSPGPLNPFAGMPDGQPLQGSDGHLYVLKGGQPVLVK
jgi:hypothetical protein